MPILLRSITLAALALASGMVAAHDGGLNTGGCHHDSEGYHCHRGGASRPSPVQHFVRGALGRSLGHASDGSANRNCTAAILACGSTAEMAHGTGPLSATVETGKQERGMKQIFEAGGPGLLALAVLLVLALYNIPGVGRRSRHHN
jgi:hypothetical protein